MLITDLSNDWKEPLQTALQENVYVKLIFKWIESGTPKPNWNNVIKMTVTTSLGTMGQYLLFTRGYCAANKRNARAIIVTYKLLFLKPRYLTFCIIKRISGNKTDSTTDMRTFLLDLLHR